MKYTVKGRSSVVVGIVALTVAGFSVVSSLARRIGVVEPRVRIERAAGEDAARAATLMRIEAVRQVVDGEVFTTADRLREACQLASVGGLMAVVERKATGAGLLAKLSNSLPPGVTQTERANVFASASSSIVIHFRSAPIGVEVTSIAKDKRSGPALIVRVAPDIPGANGAKVWSTTRLDNIQLPQPFAPESEVIAAGWQATDLRAGQ
jgi:hypothetical protein